MTRRALVVDDSSVARALVARVLREEGWQVDEAEDAASATARLAEAPYDVILLDFVLPDEDGVACLRRWRAGGLRTPVLALTSAESEEVLSKLILAGAHDVVRKDRLDAGTLLDAVASTSEPPGFPEDELPSPTARGATSAPLEERAGEVPRGLRALVVDDTATARRYVRALLEGAGWRVEEAATAEAALAVAARHDVLFVDYLLPDVDGIALTLELRKAGIATPVVGLTAHGSERTAMEFIRAGATVCLGKEGLDRARLLQAAADALAR